MENQPKKSHLAITGTTTKAGADRAAHILAWGKTIALVLVSCSSFIRHSAPIPCELIIYHRNYLSNL